MLVRLSPKMQGKYAPTLIAAHYGETPHIAALAVTYGEGTALIWIIAQIRNLSEFCALSVPLDAERAEDLANIVRRKYGHLRVAELMSFLVDFKSGRFGQVFYASFDPVRFMAALNEWEVWRVAEITRIDQANERAKREDADRIARQVTDGYDRALRRTFGVSYADALNYMINHRGLGGFMDFEEAARLLAAERKQAEKTAAEAVSTPDAAKTENREGGEQKTA